jgi:hypothetical protein
MERRRVSSAVLQVLNILRDIRREPYLMPSIAIVVGLSIYPAAKPFRAVRYGAKATATAITRAGITAILALGAGLAVVPVSVSVEVI